MRVSSCWIRPCVCSTVPDNVSTFVLTPPTSVRTYFLVAHAGARATVSDSNDAAMRLLRIVSFLLNNQINALRPCIRLARAQQGSSSGPESRADANLDPDPA